ncbi:hypothetical protein ACO0LB_17050 [Undibacterium sp. SXout7W]|uniref:hypothetical protein n=1 Tax=Undibacterium sp. SXout7W TaxID=3413049 RepID=UPI003BF3A331
MCPKEDPDYLAMWIALMIGGILFGAVMTFLITKIKQRRRDKVRNTPIDNSMVPILPTGIAADSPR